MKEISADAFKEKLAGSNILAEWVIEAVNGIIDDMPATNEQPEILYSAMIPLNPRAKKNNQKIIRNKRTNAPMIVQGDIYKQYEKDCGWFLKPLKRPIDTPVNIKCVFYRDSARRCDLTNLLEAIDDILVDFKIIEDDNFNVLVSHDGSRVFVDRLNPRTEIIITSAEV